MTYPLYTTSQPLDLFHNTHSFDDITPYLYMTSHPLCVQHHIPYMRHDTHILWDHPTLCMASHALYSWHHCLYIWHYIHSVSSDQCINYPTPTLCMTSHTLYVWHYSQCAWHHMNTLWCHTRKSMTSQRVCLWHHNNIYDINATTFMKTQWIYLTSHSLYLTSQPLYLWWNIHCIVAITKIMEVIPLGTCMTSYTLYMKSQSHFMTSFLSICDIIATAFMTSDPLHMTSRLGFMISRPLYLWHLRHC